MDSILVRLILCGLLISSVLGCSAINPVPSRPQSEQKVEEKDVPDEAGSQHPGTSPQAPGVTNQAPAPPVEQPWQGVSPAEHRPKRYNWSDRKGWSPGQPEKDSAQP